MNAGFFPYVRDSCAARFLLELIGPTQQGKTTGAQRFATLHGLGQVKGDFSVAALGSLGDIGLLVLDNKEQANFGQPLIDFCLFLATGGERGRAEVDGRLRTATSGRPVGMITTIEGVAKAELQSRCVEVNYGVTGAKSPREPIEQEISECRHEIGSAIMLVLQRYLKVRNEHRPTPNPIPDFEEHFGVLCDLLRAYGEIAGNPPDWAEGIIKDWNAALSAAEPDEDDLEHPILRVLDDVDTGPPKLAFTHNDAKGTLYVTEAFELLTAFQKLNLRDLSLPKTAQGLSRRLRSCRFRSLTFLPTDTEGVAALKRTAHRKPIGFFRPDEE
jgi:hypothetical protein